MNLETKAAIGPVCAKCGNDGGEGSLYLTIDARWNKSAGAWELEEREDDGGAELDCLNCDHRTPVMGATNDEAESFFPYGLHVQPPGKGLGGAPVLDERAKSIAELPAARSICEAAGFAPDPEAERFIRVWPDGAVAYAFSRDGFGLPSLSDWAVTAYLAGAPEEPELDLQCDDEGGQSFADAIAAALAVAGGAA